jgi:hypothetical protein
MNTLNTLYDGTLYQVVRLNAVLAEEGGGSIDAIGTQLEEMATELTSLAPPLAIFSLVLFMISWIVVPILPDWASSMKGWMQKALVVLALIGFVPTIVAALFAIGSAGGGDDDTGFLLDGATVAAAHAQEVLTTAMVAMQGIVA